MIHTLGVSKSNHQHALKNAKPVDSPVSELNTIIMIALISPGGMQTCHMPSLSTSDQMNILSPSIVRPVKRDWEVLSKDTPVDISM